MLRKILVFYHNSGFLCLKLHKDTRKRECDWDSLAQKNEGQQRDRKGNSEMQGPYYLQEKN